MKLQQNFVSSDYFRVQLKKFYERPVTKVSVELVLSIVTVMVFALFALRPTLNTMSQLLKEIEDKRKVNEALEQKARALGTAQRELTTFENRFQILSQAIHPQLSLDSALYYLEYLVARENITLAQLQIEEFPLGEPEQTPSPSPSPAPRTAQGTTPATAARTPKEINEYAFQVTFDGEYGEVLRFFAALEQVRPLFVVNDFSFRTRESSDDTLTMSASATVYMYGYGEPKREEETNPRGRQNQSANDEEAAL